MSGAPGAGLRRIGSLSARDTVHLAVMQRYDVEEILTFATAFDTVSGVRRRS